jgi:glycosyltransferase involved in cell wall biosynthesis
MKEVVSRPAIFKVWKFIERAFVPKFTYGYTVNTYIRDILKKDYDVEYTVIRNMPLLANETKTTNPESFILYQGTVNHGRSFETLIPAFKYIDVPFFIYGKGNFIEEAKILIQKNELENKVFLKGTVEPSKLREITSKAILGITLFENQGLSNYYSLANRFFDYIHAGIPQLCVDYPAYHEINNQYKVAVLIEDLSSLSIANAINTLLENKNLQNELRANCLKAREAYNWQTEEKSLIGFYRSIFETSPLAKSIR